jgi:hypothetical protein
MEMGCCMGGRRLFSSGGLAISTNSRGPVTDQELVFSALRQVSLIVAEHLVSGPRDADEAITQLIAVLDTPELAAAMNRMERGYGLRVVK